MTQPALVKIPPQPPDDLPIPGFDEPAKTPPSPPPMPEPPPAELLQEPQGVEIDLKTGLETFTAEADGTILVKAIPESSLDIQPQEYRNTELKGVLYRTTKYNADGSPAEVHWVNISHRSSSPVETVAAEFIRLCNYLQDNGFVVTPPERGLAPLIPQGANITPPPTPPKQVGPPSKPTSTPSANPSPPGQPDQSYEGFPDGTIGAGSSPIHKIWVDVDKVVNFKVGNFNWPFKDHIFKMGPDKAQARYDEIVDQETGLKLEHFTVVSVLECDAFGFVADWYIQEKPNKEGKLTKYYNIYRIRKAA